MPAPKVHLRRQQRQEEAREKINITRQLNQINENIEELEKLAKAENGGSSNQIGALKAATESRMKLLNKLLPDVKYIEMDANVTTDHESQLDELE